MREVYLGKRTWPWLSRCSQLDDVRAGYGDAVVLARHLARVPEHGSLAVLGRNGVGKTTLLLTIMGYTQMRRGAVALARRRTSRGWPPHRRARRGIGWVAQEREIFPSLSVEENLTVAARPGRWDLDTRVRAVSAARRAARATWATSSPAASSRCSRSRAR